MWVVDNTQKGDFFLIFSSLTNLIQFNKRDRSRNSSLRSKWFCDPVFDPLREPSSWLTLGAQKYKTNIQRCWFYISVPRNVTRPFGFLTPQGSFVIFYDFISTLLVRSLKSDKSDTSSTYKVTPHCNYFLTIFLQ